MKPAGARDHGAKVENDCDNLWIIVEFREIRHGSGRRAARSAPQGRERRHAMIAPRSMITRQRHLCLSGVSRRVAFPSPGSAFAAARCAVPFE